MKEAMMSLIAVVLWGARLQGAETAAIAVTDLSSAGISAQEATSLTNALRSELGKTGKYTVMERSQMETVLKEQGFQASGACDETSCAIVMGQLLAVNYVVLGSVGRVGKTYTVNVRLVDVRTGQISRDITENYKGESDGLLTRVVPIAAQKLAGTYTVKSKRPIWIAVGSAAAVAIAVPVAVFAARGSDDDSESFLRLRVQW